MIGVYDAKQHYKRVGEFYSGGIGPHEIKILKHSTTLVVANGGVKTHPDTGRSKLNLNTMASNLSYIDAGSGTILDVYELQTDVQKLSIRHIDINSLNEVVFAMQFYGEARVYPELFGIHRYGESLTTTPVETGLLKMLRNYCGSVAVLDSERCFAVSAPRGNKVLLVSTGDHSHKWANVMDGCGILGAGKNGLLVSSGTGTLQRLVSNFMIPTATNYRPDINWDNHMG